MADVYVARKRLKVGDSYRMPGDEVPEAAGWRNLHSYLSSGAVVLVQTDRVQATGNKQRIPLPPQRNRWQDDPRALRHSPDQLAGWTAAPVAVPIKVRVRRSSQE